MRKNWVQKFERGFALLEILLVAIVIFFLSYLGLKTYFKNPSFSMDNSTQEALTQQGIDTRSHQAVLDSTREKIKDINKQLSDSEKQLEDYR